MCGLRCLGVDPSQALQLIQEAQSIGYQDEALNFDTTETVANSLNNIRRKVKNWLSDKDSMNNWLYDEKIIHFCRYVLGKEVKFFYTGDDQMKCCGIIRHNTRVDTRLNTTIWVNFTGDHFNAMVESDLSPAEACKNAYRLSSNIATRY